MGFIVFSVFMFLLAHVLRSTIRNFARETGRKPRPSPRASAWETVSREWETARRDRLSRNTTQTTPKSTPVPLRPEPAEREKSMPALERLRAELEGGADAPEPPPLPLEIGLPGGESGPGAELDLVLAAPVEPSVEAPGNSLGSLGNSPGKPPVESAGLPERGSGSSPAEQSPPRGSEPLTPLGGGDAGLLESLTASLESAATQGPASEVRYSISSSLVRPAARLLSAVRTALAVPGREGDKAMVEVTRGLPMFGVVQLSGRHLEPEALAEALDALDHASPALRSAVYSAAAQLAVRLQPVNGLGVVRALNRLANPED